MEYKLQTNNVTVETECADRQTITAAVRKSACLLEECLGMLDAITEHISGESRPSRPKLEIKGLMQDVCENTEMIISLEHGLENLRAILGE